MKAWMLVVSAAIIYSSCSLAELDGTVLFEGEVYPRTCDININGNGKSPIVLLPTVDVNQLATAQSVAGITKFTINVTDCDFSSSVIRTVFTGNNITVNGNLRNAGTAGNVSVQLLDADGIKVLQFINGESVETSPFIKGGDLSMASQDLMVQYYAESTVTAGTVIASAKYSITYQ